MTSDNTPAPVDTEAGAQVGTIADSAPLVAVRALLKGFTDASEEAAVLGLLNELTAAQVDELTLDAKLLETLISSIDNHLRGKHYSDDLMVWFASRFGDASIQGRANLLHALAKDASGKAASVLIEAIFLGTFGQELTTLKNALDAGEDHLDLEELVFHQVGGASRKRIIAHIAEQAGEIHNDEVKILSDFDDTVQAGMRDELHSTGIIYPGVVEFWKALDAGNTDKPFSIGDLVLITARPGAAFGVVENQLRGTLRNIGAVQPSVITGTISGLRSHKAMAKTKLAAIENFAQLYPEYPWVFIGDSGQGDVLVAEELHQRWPEKTKATFIHDVTLPTDDVSAPKYDRDEQAAKDIHFFDTYIGAALKAHQLGLITAQSLAEVVTATQQGYADLTWDTSVQQGRLTQCLRADLDALG
ncbi:MAG: App1 family protein [Propionibacteriaceae bacterium]|jgi:hypothetical protein|nr:App1 family protein [Propionibacteriaceae bacterium]